MKNIKSKTIFNSLRKYRRAKGLSQKDVAEILGIKSTSQISRWERGVCLPITSNLLDLALLYRTSMDALLIDLRRLRRNELLVKEYDVLKNKKEDEK
jgi:transcriptional regulator with XRE-family HTH domain